MTGVPVSTLQDWATKRERGIDAPGPHHIRLSNRHRDWTRRDVDHWIESARIQRAHVDPTLTRCDAILWKVPTYAARARPTALLRVASAASGRGSAPLQKTLGHASIAVTVHIYANLYIGELDEFASALDALDDTRKDLP